MAFYPHLHTLAVPVFLLIFWTTNHYFSSDCTATSVPPYSCSSFNLSLLLRYILKPFPPVSRIFISLSPLWTSILALKLTCWENHLYGLADEAEKTGAEALDLTPADPDWKFKGNLPQSKTWSCRGKLSC